MRYCSPRNAFDSCVKSWQYFCMDKILLETLFYWLSDVVRFEIDVAFTRNLQKCNSKQTQNGHSAAHCTAATSLSWRPLASRPKADATHSINRRRKIGVDFSYQMQSDTKKSVPKINTDDAKIYNKQ